MSGRIALMVRGLPSLPIEDAINRFGKYYAKPKSDVFHESPSFVGISKDNSISFLNRETNNYEGGGGATKEAFRDLRQLAEDFKAYSTDNPSIYTANPTTPSRAKLYKRAGMNNLEGDTQFQAMDTRRIAQEDIPYTQALDSGLLDDQVNQILGTIPKQAFLKMPDNTIRSFARFSKGNLNGLFNESRSVDGMTPYLRQDLEYGLKDATQRRQRLVADRAALARENEIAEQERLSREQRNQEVLRQHEERRRMRLPENRIPWLSSQGMIPRIELNPYR